MKIMNFIAFACLLSMLSCSKKDNAVASDGFSVHFSCTFLDLVNTKSEDFPVSKIEFFLYNLDNGDRIHIVQNKGEDAFGSFETILSRAAYDCVVIAHSSLSSVTDDVITFDKVSETFRGTESFELERGTNSSFNVELSRINTRVEVVASDAMTSDASLVSLSVDNISEGFSILSGKPASFKSLTRTFSLKKEDTGREGIKFSANMFSGDKLSTLTFQVISDNGEFLSNFRTEPLLFLPNRISRFTGCVFRINISSSGHIHINTDWDQIEENELPLSD